MTFHLFRTLYNLTAKKLNLHNIFLHISKLIQNFNSVAERNLSNAQYFCIFVNFVRCFLQVNSKYILFVRYQQARSKISSIDLIISIEKTKTIERSCDKSTDFVIVVFKWFRLFSLFFGVFFLLLLTTQ